MPRSGKYLESLPQIRSITQLSPRHLTERKSQLVVQSEAMKGCIQFHQSRSPPDKSKCWYLCWTREHNHMPRLGKYWGSLPQIRSIAQLSPCHLTERKSQLVVQSASLSAESSRRCSRFEELDSRSQHLLHPAVANIFQHSRHVYAQLSKAEV